MFRDYLRRGVVSTNQDRRQRGDRQSTIRGDLGLRVKSPPPIVIRSPCQGRDWELSGAPARRKGRWGKRSPNSRARSTASVRRCTSRLGKRHVACCVLDGVWRQICSGPAISRTERLVGRDTAGCGRSPSLNGFGKGASSPSRSRLAGPGPWKLKILDISSACDGPAFALCPPPQPSGAGVKKGRANSAVFWLGHIEAQLEGTMRRPSTSCCASRADSVQGAGRR